MDSKVDCRDGHHSEHARMRAPLQSPDGSIMKSLLRLVLFSIAFAGIGATANALAQGYPSKPLRLIVPFPPGGPTDVFARQYASRLAAVLGQPVVIDNKSGAGGAIGAVEVKKSDPDGYTLLFGSASNLGLYNLMSSTPLYDALKDFVHVASLGGAPAVFAVNPSMPQTLKGVVEMARAKPGSIQYGSPGQGTYLHLAAERLKQEAGNIDIQHIPFRGSAQTLTALLGGQVGMTVETLGTVLAGHRAGILRIVAVASPKRSPLVPEVPTVDEAIGTKGFDGCYGMSWRHRPERLQRSSTCLQQSRARCSPTRRSTSNWGSSEFSQPPSPVPQPPPPTSGRRSRNGARWWKRPALEFSKSAIYGRELHGISAKDDCRYKSASVRFSSFSTP
jgi:tripartite-type tricarboxylate transporter receptor subunit TctC